MSVSVLQQTVTHLFTTEKRGVDELHKGVPLILEAIKTAAEALQEAGFPDEADECKLCTKQLCEFEMKVAAQAKAISKMQLTYTAPNGEDFQETDFEAMYEEALQQSTPNNFNPEEAEAYQDLEEELNNMRGITATANEGEDGDLQMETTNDLAPNRACPICSRPLLELEEPVEDQKGFVYEKSAVYDHIRRNPTGQVPCPVAGTSHRIQITNLRPARKVVRAQKRAKNQPTQTQAANDDEDIMDVV